MVDDDLGQSVRRVAGETEVLRENLPQYHSAHKKSHMVCPEMEPGPPRWETGD
jgi:hypothetical protein